MPFITGGGGVVCCLGRWDDSPKNVQRYELNLQIDSVGYFRRYLVQVEGEVSESLPWKC